MRSVTRTLQGYADDIEAREDAGTPAILGKIRTALAFKVKEELGTDANTRREHHLFRRAAERPGANPQVRLLNDLFGIQARGGCACAGPYGHTLLNIDETGSEKYLQCVLGDPEGIKPGWTRLNLAPWVTDEEADFLLSAVEWWPSSGRGSCRCTPSTGRRVRGHTRGTARRWTCSVRPARNTPGGRCPTPSPCVKRARWPKRCRWSRGDPRPAPCARRGRVLRVLIHPRPRQSAVVGMPSGPQGSSLRIPNER